jgi:nitroreductase
MEFSEVVRIRRSIRKFRADPVPDIHIQKLLEAARLAPSGLNLQPWRFAIVKSESTRKKLAKATLATYAMEAPVVIICCADMEAFSSLQKRVAELQQVQAFSGTCFQGFAASDFLAGGTLNESAIKANLALQVAIAIEHIALQAVDLGLGTCWIASFDEKEVKRITGISDRYSIVALLPVGYPAYQPGPRPRLSIDELLIATPPDDSNSEKSSK